ncbi:MAG TPA: M24 family metallopeptidase [Arcobacter sp.]|nr:M24 family metallopeptidase [Arcobacter sp.]
MKNFLLQNENAIYYECGYSCDNCIYLSLGSERFFITDARYEIDAGNHLKKGCELFVTNDLVAKCRKILQKSNIKKINFDPNDFSLSSYLNLTKKLNIKFIKTPNFSKLKRIIKSDDEIKLIKKAMTLGRSGFEKFQDYLQNDAQGKSEKYLAYMAQTFLSNYGKYDLSFEAIIAINENAAKPHAVPTSKKYDRKDLLLFDGGIKYKRYCSDRTVTFGNDLSVVSNTQRTQKFKNKKQQKVYDIVLKAQETTIKTARVGMKASQIDKIGRDIITKAGYGKYFVHSTGHGVGLDIHEYPNISSKSDFIIEENMVYTIEPGIYLQGEFGVRIEDTVVMRSKKAEIL